MSAVKKALKAAKTAIEKGDPESAIEYAQEAIDEDSECYFAYVFQGKAYQLLNDVNKAAKAFEKATAIEPENLLGWKGYFQSVKSGTDYPLFFQVLTSYIAVLIEQELPFAETIKDVRNYLAAQNYKANEGLHELFLRSVLPGSELGDLVGANLGRPEDNLRDLITLVAKKVEREVTSKSRKERVKFGRFLTADQRTKLNQLSWSVYQQTDLESLYESFLNISSDDELRTKFEEDLLKFRYELLKTSPEKDLLLHKVKEMVEGMVLVKSTSEFCWNLYFNWLDVKSLAEIEQEKIIFYLNTFPNEGLAIVLYAFVVSEISPFDKDLMINEVIAHKNELSKQKESKRKSNFKSKEDEELYAKLKEFEDDDDSAQYNLTQTEVLTQILAGFDRSSDCVLSNRIIIEYYIHLREYSVGSERCRESIKLLADMQRNFGVDLSNTREDFLCSLAIIYTYYEAPKNFTRALQLYDKILDGNPANVKARVGKGLILIEKNDFTSSKVVLEEVVSKYPDNVDAQIEYHWCLILLKEYSVGREGLHKAMTKVTGVDLNSKETRAMIRWRLARSYFLEDDSNTENLAEAYKLLIDALKDTQFYAPAYTLLGILFQDYYGDKDHGQRCFYKAFELDVVETTAARYVVEELTSKKEWDIAEVLCKRIIDSENARRQLSNLNKDITDRSWPYRVLGFCALNKQDDAGAIGWFQNALRISPLNYNCWAGLGESYLSCGRFDAAVKVLRHALGMKEDAWEIKYLLGITLCKMAQFEEGYELLFASLETRPEEECILNAIYEAYLENTKRFLKGGFLRRANQSNLDAIKYIRISASKNKSSQNLWKALAECLRFYLQTREQIELFPLVIVDEIFESVNFHDASNDFVAQIEHENELSVEDNIALFNSGKHVQSISNFIILCSKAALSFVPSKSSRYLKSVAFYNLGLSYLENFHLTEDEITRDQAVKSIKRAIQLEDNNIAYWIALGNAYVSSNPGISQHCFIKASALDPKNINIWINLAALYLRAGDMELAEETFFRAQAVAPSETQPWLGQALTAEEAGNEIRAASFFSHAYTISKGRSQLAQFLFGLSVLQRRLADTDPKDNDSAQEYSVANQAMIGYLKYVPDDEIALRIAITVAERCKNYILAISIGERLCEILEKKYEELESEVALTDYAKAKSQLARIYLGALNYEKALEYAQFSIDLVGEDSTEMEVSSIVLSSRVTIGLSLFFNDDFESALKELKSVLAQHGDSRRIATLVAQILYAYGQEETKQAALDQLFSFVEEHGSSLIVVLTLGAICVSDNLEDYFSPLRDELLGFSLTDLIEDTQKAVPQLLTEINKRIDSSASMNDKTWQKNAFLFPSDYNVWKQLNIEMASSVGSLEESKLNAPQLSEAYLLGGSLRDAQRSLLLTPDSIISTSVLSGFFR
ncbi:antiviral protein [Scheffersomyces xylosifermentans]|uniref:antiviral protein n=1 Tax=Scheffersomyces xylosifermentans TaxID=1304137 RepID=UPI00315DD281